VTSHLDKSQRDELNSIVTNLRRILTDDVSDLLEGRYGIRPDGKVEPPTALHLADDGQATRRELEQILLHFAAEDDRGRTGRERLVREAVFTHVNRLIAIRIAESLKLLPQSIAEGRASKGFRDIVADVAPLLGADNTGGYWSYLTMCGDELAADAPTLFDPRNPLLALTASPKALDQVVEVLRSAPDAIWEAADTLGWAYQFFNTKEERRQMREGGAPATSRELAVRNQFFTPEYVVSYLVHNSLGRRLMEADPTSPLIDDLSWLVDPPMTRGAALDLAEVKLLDPACGSGHFLLGAYDVLERAWHHVGVGREDAAARIVPALWGIDIDPRAAQVAAAAVIFRARRSCGRDAPLPRPSIACARSLPPIPDAELALLTPSHRHVLRELDAELQQAPLLGSLLKVETVLTAHGAFGTARSQSKGMAPLPVAEHSIAGAASIRADVLELVRRTAGNVASTPAERLTAAEADDALRFVQALSQGYDAVLMNPPFGEPVSDTRPYLKAAYPWIPTKDNNLLAAFVGRGIELCNEHGYVGAITSRTALFLSTFEAWRRQVLLGNHVLTLADLGFGVMEEADVEAAAYVLGRSPSDELSVFLRLTRDADRGPALRHVVQLAREREQDDRVTLLDTHQFARVPGARFAYRLGKLALSWITERPQLEGNGTEVRVGLQTGDDFRFVRAIWEINPRRIGRTREETMSGKCWVPFAKGGEYAPYWADIHLVVEYAGDGERIRKFEGSRPQNLQYFFRPGVTWPSRTNSAMAVRVLPSGCIFGHKGPAVLANHPLLHLAWLNSRYVRMLIDVQSAAAEETRTGGVPSRSYEVGIIQTLPSLTSWQIDESSVAFEARGLASRLAELDETYETATRFVKPVLLHEQDGALGAYWESAVEILEGYARIDRLIGQALDPARQIDDLLVESTGPLVAELPDEPVETGDATASLTRPVADAIPQATDKYGVARWINLQHQVVDRQLELAALVLNVAPRAVVRAAAGALPLPTNRVSPPEDTFSYLAGCAFGRWDVRIGRDPSRAPKRPAIFDPVPVCPPGMLVDADGLPARDPPDGYPLRLPSQRVLLDEPGHRLDVVSAVEAAAAALADSPSELLHDLEEALGHQLRDHFRRQFFKDHLGRYSRSRRKAPIYWPLYVPSKQWGLWVYAPALTRETLFAVEAAADQRLGSAIAEIRRLEGEQLQAGGRTTRELAARLEQERKLAEELRRFHSEASRIAGLGWEPDLDDGIVLCAAPLVELFPDWRAELATARRDLKRGAFDEWATVARYKAAL
jgi:hypothetical protein